MNRCIMNRCIKVMTTALLFAFTGVSSAFAGQWMQDSGRAALKDGVTNWWWQEDDGSRARDCSLWLDGNQDGTYEKYTFNEEGWMIADTVTEYGGQINADGALMVDADTVSQMIVPRDTTAVTTPEFTLTLPDNWKNHFSYQLRGSDLLIEFFPMKRMEYDGTPRDHVAETMAWIMAFDDKAERDTLRALGIWGNWRDLGTHRGTYYVSCSPTDTAMGFYTEEERALMGQMRESLWAADGVGLWGRMEFH